MFPLSLVIIIIRTTLMRGLKKISEVDLEQNNVLKGLDIKIQ